MLKTILVITVALFIVSCGDSSTSANPDSEFDIFPSSMFVTGTNKITNFTATDSNENSYTLILSEQTLADSQFLSQTAITIMSQLHLTNLSTGASISSFMTSFFSTSATERRFIGFSTSQSATVSAETSIIPQTAKIGDFGSVGTYTDNVGNVTTKSFRVENGGNGNGKVVILTIERDQFEAILLTEAITTLIDPNGNILSQAIVLFFADSDVTLTFNET